jgi:hypothetical protein
MAHLNAVVKVPLGIAVWTMALASCASDSAVSPSRCAALSDFKESIVTAVESNRPFELTFALSMTQPDEEGVAQIVDSMSRFTFQSSRVWTYGIEMQGKVLWSKSSDPGSLYTGYSGTLDSIPVEWNEAGQSGENEAVSLSTLAVSFAESACGMNSAGRPESISPNDVRISFDSPVAFDPLEFSSSKVPLGNKFEARMISGTFKMVPK